MVTVSAGEPTRAVEGYRLVIDGVSALTSIATDTVCVTLVLGTPVATIVIFAAYAVAFGSKPLLLVCS